MPVLSFQPADALQTILVEAGQYPSEIAKIEGPKASKSGKSVSYVVTIRITDGKYKGKERDVMFNSEVNNSSLLGDMQFFPTSDFLQIDAAINNTKIEPVQKNIDTDDLCNKPLETVWGVQAVEGKMVNLILAFRPVGSGQPAF